MELVLKKSEFIFNEKIKFEDEKTGKTIASAKIQLTPEDVQTVRDYKNEVKDLSDEDMFKIIYKNQLKDFRAKTGEYYLAEFSFTIMNALISDMGLKREQATVQFLTTILQNKKITE